MSVVRVLNRQFVWFQVSCEGSVQHFAAATIEQLSENSLVQFHEIPSCVFNSCSKKSNFLIDSLLCVCSLRFSVYVFFCVLEISAFFVIVDGHLHKVAEKVIQELAAVYMSKGTHPSICASAIFPKPDAESTLYYLLQNPACGPRAPSEHTEGKMIPRASTSLLVEFVPNSSANRKSFVGVLGGFCMWRACCNQAVPDRHLCLKHESLKIHLDSRSSQHESSRFFKVFRAAQATDAIGNVDAIIKASTLLQELENRRLVSTIDLYCRKAASGPLRPTASFRKCSSMTWAEERGEHEQALERLGHELDLFSSILFTEKSCTAELQLIEAGSSPLQISRIWRDHRIDIQAPLVEQLEQGKRMQIQLKSFRLDNES